MIRSKLKVMNNLKASTGRVIVLIDLEQKNYWTFNNGQIIRLERDRDNFDRKYTQQVLGTVIDAENIPTGALVLCNHNCTHDTYKVFNYKTTSGQEISDKIFYFSIPETEVYLWKTDGGEWMPAKNFEIVLRVFKPYTGIIQGIEPTKIKNLLYVKTGEFKGQAVRTLKASDYEITFRNEKGVDEQIIRCRHFENEDHPREEIIAIDHNATEKINNGELYVGISTSDAKPLKELVYG